MPNVPTVTTTVTEQELRHLRRESIQHCEELRYWLQHLHALSVSNVQANASMGGKLDAQVAKLSAIHERQADPVALTRGHERGLPLFVDGENALRGPTGPTGPSGAHGTRDDPAFVKVAGTPNDESLLGVLADLRTDLWFGLGLLATMLFGYGLWRQVMPRA